MYSEWSVLRSIRFTGYILFYYLAYLVKNLNTNENYTYQHRNPSDHPTVHLNPLNSRNTYLQFSEISIFGRKLRHVLQCNIFWISHLWPQNCSLICGHPWKHYDKSHFSMYFREKHYFSGVIQIRWGSRLFETCLMSWERCHSIE